MLDGRATRSRAPGWRRSTLDAEGRAGAHQRHAGRRPRSPRWRCSAPSGSRAPPTSPRRCRSTGCAARCIRSSARMHDARPHAGQRASAANLLRLLRRQRHQRVARELRPRPGRLLDALRAAGARRGARRARLRARARSRSRPTPPPTTRWSSPTTGDIVSGGNFHGAPVAIAADLLVLGARAAGDDQRAARPTGWSIRRSAACRRSSRATAACIGLHDGAGDRGGAGVRDQDARASRRASTRSRPRPTGKTTSA